MFKCVRRTNTNMSYTFWECYKFKSKLPNCNVSNVC
nr:MAG TPA: hypothetical protein [Caudoviricetes sp.]